MKVSALRKDIQQQKFSSFYVLYGTESYLIDDLKQTIIDHAVEDDMLDFNLSVFDMEETVVSVAIDDANTLPFMGERRVVVLKNPYFLTGTKDKKKVEHDLKKLQSYIEDPSPHAIIVFVGTYEKLDARKKIVKTLKKNGEVIEFSALNEDMTYDLLSERAQREGAVLTREANERLLQLLGPNLLQLMGEVEKMALFAGEGQAITPKIVELLVSRTLESNVFSLVNQVVNRRLDEGFHILHDLFKQNEEPIKLLALLARQFRIMFQVKQLKEQSYTQNEIAKQFKLHPYAVKIAENQGRAFAKKELLQMLDLFAEADFKMKSGQMEKRLVLELLLPKLVAS